jgi:hypothetical protein
MWALVPEFDRARLLLSVGFGPQILDPHCSLFFLPVFGPGFSTTGARLLLSVGFLVPKILERAAFLLDETGSRIRQRARTLFC